MPYDSQASGIVDHAFLQNLYEGFAGNGFVSGGVVSSAGTDLDSDYTGFTARVNGTEITVAGGSVTHSAGDPTNPRMDMVVVDSAGTVSIVEGTPTAEGATQTRPPLSTLDDGDLIMAVVYVPDNAAVILDANIFDRRIEAFTHSPATTVTLDNDLRVERRAAFGDGSGLLAQVVVGIDQSYTGSAIPAMLFVAGDITLDGNSAAYFTSIFPDSTTVNNGVTASVIATLRLVEPNITLNGTGAATVAATLLINSAPTEATDNYALFVDSGLARFDGNGTDVFELPADATDPTGAGGAATGRIPVKIGGATVYLAYY